MCILKKSTKENIWYLFLILKTKDNEELQSKLRDIIRTITIDLDDYDEKNTKIEFNSDDDLFPNKTSERHNITIVFAVVFNEDSNYYTQVLLDECLLK